jgi:hypothetical protein
MADERVAIIRAIRDDPELMMAAHKAVEDVLIEFRDRRISAPLHGNGLVAREADGKDGSIIRLGAREGIRLALKAIADHLEREGDGGE